MIDAQTPSPDSLDKFVEGIAGEDLFRIEEDFGSGFVRLKSSEAERRQAAQDIQASEDIVIELLRNSRDANANNIFLSSQKDGQYRKLIILDDGDGIPLDMHDRIFQPRVTSKLDSAHLDKWGIHGRGMALYSIRVNSVNAEIALSIPGQGSSISILTDTAKLPEKTDQSTFPYFDKTASGFSMRGPKNILRCTAEFAFEHRNEISIYCGTNTEIAATMYAHGLAALPPSKRIFSHDKSCVNLTELLSLTQSPEEFAEVAETLGLEISTRSARRIIDGEIAPLPSMLARIESESFRQPQQKEKKVCNSSAKSPKVSFSKEDLDEFSEELGSAFSILASKYYLEKTEPDFSQHSGKLIVSFDLRNQQ